jgi:hypothetical protein
MNARRLRMAVVCFRTRTETFHAMSVNQLVRGV